MSYLCTKVLIARTQVSLAIVERVVRRFFGLEDLYPHPALLFRQCIVSTKTVAYSCSLDKEHLLRRISTRVLGKINTSVSLSLIRASKGISRRGRVDAELVIC